MDDAKISRQIIIARIPVHIKTGLPEETLRSVASFVEERFSKHEKAAGDRLGDNKKAETLIITLLDIAAQLFSARQEIKRLKQSDSEDFAALDSISNTLSKIIDDFEK